MHESEPLKGLIDAVKSQEPTPSEESKIIISLLMRIYDTQMAILTHLDSDSADKVYDAHERGENFNPTIYIPEIKDSMDSVPEIKDNE